MLLSLPFFVVPWLSVSVPPPFAVFSLPFRSSSSLFPQKLAFSFALFIPIVPKRQANGPEECSL